jgi:oxygen-independent coproporphyrinogen III oxidase
VQKLLSLNPDRVALYGYAHVPWMARRQVMIPSEALPAPEERLELFETARGCSCGTAIDEIGIDHFARPERRAGGGAREGRLRRNFQGYTDDRRRCWWGWAPRRSRAFRRAMRRTRRRPRAI